MQINYMPRLEAFTEKIFSDSRWPFKVVIGGVLTLTILGIPWVLGYFYNYAQQVRMRGSLQLPDWHEWDRRLFDGIRMLAIFALFVGVPWMILLLAVWLVESVLGSWGGLLAWGMFSVYLIVVPPLLVAAILQFQRTENFRSLLNYKPIADLLSTNWQRCVLPVLAYNGCLFIGLPIFTFAFFLGTNLLIAYLLLVFLSSNIQNK